MADEKPSWMQNEEDEEDQEVDENEYRSAKDAIIFAIEVSASMLRPPTPSDSKKAEKDSATSAALKCAYQLMQQRIISQPSDMMGVLLFGTEQTKFQEEGARGSLAFPHCYLLTDLDIPSAEDVKALKSLTEDEDEDARQILKPYKDPVTMPNVIFCANQVFTRKAPNFGSRRLFIITDNDDPHSNDKDLRQQAATRAKDLYDLGVVIELFPISRPDHEFSRDKFYNDIIYRDPSDPDAPVSSSPDIKSSEEDGITLLSSLVSSINSKQTPKRALFSNLPFEIGPGFRISVKGYNILQPQKPARSCYVYLDGPVAQLATGETQKMAGATGRVIAKTEVKSEVKKAYKFGGEQIFFTPEEVKSLRNFGPPGITVIGFKPLSMLPQWASVNKSTFIYPSEDDYTGSTRVFSALWQKLLKDKKMGLAWYIARTNSTPMLVAILPSPPSNPQPSTSGSPVIPAGLWLYPLPYSDDIREPAPAPTPMEPPEVLIDRMHEVIQQLQLPGAIYDPGKYPNPSLQWHYRILQCLALEEEIPNESEIEDKTIPKYRQINKRAGPYVVDWGTELEKAINAWRNELGNGPKRGASEDGVATTHKKKKLSATDSAELGTPELKTYMNEGKLKSLTLPQIKLLLISRGISTMGKKADLLERLEEWLENN